MLAMTPEQLNLRYPISRLEFYERGMKVIRKTKLKKSSPRGKRKAIELLSPSSLSRLAFLAQNTPLNLLSMLTLSYGEIYPSDGYLLKMSLNRFLTFLRTRYAPLGYIWFLEFQRRGAPHIHLLLDQPVVETDRRLVASRWLIAALESATADREYPSWLVADTALKMFQVHRHSRMWETLRSENGGRGYVTKYATKPTQKAVPVQYANVGRFWGNSRNAKAIPLSTQTATEQGVRLYLKKIGHPLESAEVLPKHISTYADSQTTKSQ